MNNLSERRETLHVEVLSNEVENRRKALVVLVTTDETDGDDWLLRCFCPADARALATFLWDAAAIAKHRDDESRARITGARQLPVVSLCGTRFFIDERLRQLRNVSNPHHCFDLDDRRN